MIKALKYLTYLIFCASLSATIYAMDPPLAGEENSSPLVQTNLLNSMENNNDIRNNILEIAGLANCVELAHVSNLELVCKHWRTIFNNIFTIIRIKDYNDASTPSVLEKNSSVKHLIIYGSLAKFFILRQESQEKVYSQVIQAGLQNKPNLKTLIFNGDLSINVLFAYIKKEDHGIGNRDRLYPKNSPYVELLKLDHLKCFLNLERLLVKGIITSPYSNAEYFTRYFMTREVLPKLELFKYSYANKSKTIEFP